MPPSSSSSSSPLLILSASPLSPPRQKRRVFLLVAALALVLYLVTLWIPHTSYIPNVRRFFSKFYQPSQESSPLLSTPLLKKNRALRDNGILPYALCGSDATDSTLIQHKTRQTSVFIFDSKVYRVVVSAASAWRSPNSYIPRLEFLAFFQDYYLKECPSSSGHCRLEKPLLKPPITCHAQIPHAVPRKGTFEVPAMKALRAHGGNEANVASIICPNLEVDIGAVEHAERVDEYERENKEGRFQKSSTASDESSSSPFNPLYPQPRYRGPISVLIQIGESNSTFPQAILNMSICYMHVPRVVEVVGCSQPLYGDLKNDFWIGSPPYPYNSTIFDAWVVYNTRVQAMDFVVADFSTQMHGLASRYTLKQHEEIPQREDEDDGAPIHRGRLFYRHGWSVFPGSQYLNFEVLTEATCQWEHRLRAHWIYILHAPDNFALPIERGERVPDVLRRRLNRTAYSGALVPMIQGNAKKEALDTSKGSMAHSLFVLQRWNMLGIEFEFGHGRHTPIFNPRHLTHASVHTPSGRMQEYRETLSHTDCVSQLKLHTLHIMALSRSGNNRFEGPRVASLDEVGERLGEELTKEFVVVDDGVQKRVVVSKPSP